MESMGETYLPYHPPPLTSKLVLREEESLKAHLNIQHLMAKMQRIPDSLRLAYYSALGIRNEDIAKKIQESQFQLAELIKQCSSTAFQLIIKVCYIIENLQCGFAYLKEGNNMAAPEYFQHAVISQEVMMEKTKTLTDKVGEKAEELSRIYMPIIGDFSEPVRPSRGMTAGERTPYIVIRGADVGCRFLSIALAPAVHFWECLRSYLLHGIALDKTAKFLEDAARCNEQTSERKEYWTSKACQMTASGVFAKLVVLRKMLESFQTEMEMVGDRIHHCIGIQEKPGVDEARGQVKHLLAEFEAGLEKIWQDDFEVSGSTE